MISKGKHTRKFRIFRRRFSVSWCFLDAALFTFLIIVFCGLRVLLERLCAHLSGRKARLGQHAGGVQEMGGRRAEAGMQRLAHSVREVSHAESPGNRGAQKSAGSDSRVSRKEIERESVYKSNRT